MAAVGLPRMHKESGEHRVFLPALVEFLERVGADDIVLEEGYGSELGLSFEAYRAASRQVREATWEECLAQDVVVVLRCPDEAALRRIRRGVVLVSMLHFATRPGRVALLRDLGIRGVSLDGVVDDTGRRLVEDLEAVAWNGVRVAFERLAERMPGFARPGRPPIRAVTLGAGAVASHVVRAVARYGDPKLQARLAFRGVPGIAHLVLDWDVTRDRAALEELLACTDLLVDATARPDPTQVIVPNVCLGGMPDHAVILDLAVDPYDFSRDPPLVKGVEGLPEGNLDQYLFLPDDPAYARIDPRVATEHRRVALSCHSWPGVDALRNMELYGKQLEPVLRVVVERGLDRIDPIRGPYFDRAVARADLHRWHATEH
jgi:alanine dehydrogenase